jgi:hypothetical protein
LSETSFFDSFGDSIPGWPYSPVAIAVLLLLLLVVRRMRADRARPSTRPSDAKPVDAKPAASAGKPEPEPTREPCAVVFASEAQTANLSGALDLKCVVVKNAGEFMAVVRHKSPKVAFVDVDLLWQLNRNALSVPVIGIVDESPAETLVKIVRTFDSYSMLSHVISASMLPTPLARTHLKALIDRLSEGPECDLLGPARVGRVAMLAQASHREARFERMQEYFSKQGMSARAISTLHEVAEELVMNALYNAPTEAGYFKAPVSRTEDLKLPLERACEISYGVEDGHAFVRLRDTFGALRRERLIEVLNRCSQTAGQVELDESRGGAGLGMWRVFSSASTLAITVIPGKLTDILLRLSSKPGKSARQLLAVHLFFVSEIDDEMMFQDSSLVDHSITLLQTNEPN